MIPSRSAARHTSATSPVGSAAASRKSHCDSSGRPPAARGSAPEPSLERQRTRQPEPARQLRRRKPSRQLQQRQRVPPRLGQELVGHPLVQSPRDHRGHERPRVGVAQALDHELRQAGEELARLPRAEQHHHRLRHQPSRHEGQHLRGGPVQPLRVVHDAQQRTLLGHLREQAQHRQAHEEPIRHGPVEQAERRRQCVALRCRKPVKAVEHRRAQLMQRGERQLALRLDPHRTEDPEIRRRRDRVLQQRRLADPRLTTQHQRAAAPCPDGLQQPRDRCGFVAAGSARSADQELNGRRPWER